MNNKPTGAQWLYAETARRAMATDKDERLIYKCLKAGYEHGLAHAPQATPNAEEVEQAAHRLPESYYSGEEERSNIPPGHYFKDDIDGGQLIKLTWDELLQQNQSLRAKVRAQPNAGLIAAADALADRLRWLIKTDRESYDAIKKALGEIEDSSYPEVEAENKRVLEAYQAARAAAPSDLNK